MALEELSVLEVIATTFRNYKSREIVEYSHKEKTYTDTIPNQVILYSLTKQLNELN